MQCKGCWVNIFNTIHGIGRKNQVNRASLPRADVILLACQSVNSLTWWTWSNPCTSSDACPECSMVALAGAFPLSAGAVALRLRAGIAASASSGVSSRSNDACLPLPCSKISVFSRTFFSFFSRPFADVMRFLCQSVKLLASARARIATAAASALAVSAAARHGGVRQHEHTKAILPHAYYTGRTTRTAGALGHRYGSAPSSAWCWFNSSDSSAISAALRASPALVARCSSSLRASCTWSTAPGFAWQEYKVD